MSRVQQSRPLASSRKRYAGFDLATVEELDRETDFNYLAHVEDHTPSWHSLVYTSKASLDTVAGTPIALAADAVIVTVRANVAQAPSGAALEYDILRNGTTIFPAGNKPTIAAGKKVGKVFRPERLPIRSRGEDNPEDDTIQVKINTVSSATGPLVVVFRILGGV